MKRLLICVTVFTFLAVPQFALAEDVDDLKAANQKLFQGWSSLDAETVASTISQGAVAYSPDAAFPIVGPMESTQAERVEYMTMYLQNIEFINMFPYNIQARVFGNVGLVWGHVTISSKAKEQPQQTQYLRYTSTWLKSDGQWRLVMNHYSVIPAGD